MTYRALLVDDEPHALDGLLLSIDWEGLGIRITGTCRNGQEAMRHMRSDPPELVVTDIRMPVMDGLSLIEETHRTGNRSTMFIIASGYHDFDYAVRAMELGVSHYLTKPVVSTEAEDILRKLTLELSERGQSGPALDTLPQADDTEAGSICIQDEVAEYLDIHYRETLTIREIAERFYIHPVYLGQSFARRFGIGILDYVHERRVEEARRLLVTTDDAISTVAERVGYNGYQHFLKQFERRIGTKPSEYRARLLSPHVQADDLH